MTSVVETIPVEQVDRTAMVSYEALSPVPLAIKFGVAVQAGKHDDDPRVQAFARHRLRARTEADRRDAPDVTQVVAFDNADQRVRDALEEGRRLDALCKANNDLARRYEKRARTLEAAVRVARGWVITCSESAQARRDLKTIDAALTGSNPGADGGEG